MQARNFSQTVADYFLFFMGYYWYWKPICPPAHEEKEVVEALHTFIGGESLFLCLFFMGICSQTLNLFLRGCCFMQHVDNYYECMRQSFTTLYMACTP